MMNSIAEIPQENSTDQSPGNVTTISDKPSKSPPSRSPPLVPSKNSQLIPLPGGKKKGGLSAPNIGPSKSTLQCRRSSYQGSGMQHTMAGLALHKKAQDILTNEQQKAFREVFDLFDSNGGGTIDAQELDEALQSADIHLSKEEIADVLSSMDKDGNGEIDFEEFLTLMTNTERFLESVMCSTLEERSQREVLLFDALTQFMKRSALHSINEIVGYYHSKYKKVQAPHVIRHYAAGARLIGLSEQQIRRHLDKLRESSADDKSPYAIPAYSFYSNTVKSKTPSQKKKDPAAEALPPLSDNLKMLVPNGGRGKIRLKFVFHDNEKIEKNGKPSQEGEGAIASLANKSRNGSETIPKRNYNTWASQRINPADVHLPVLTIDVIKAQIMAEKMIGERIQKKRALNFDDMAVIRSRVSELTKLYYKRIQSEKCFRAEHHWDSLAVDRMSQNMQPSFFRVFKSYSDYKTTPVCSLASVLLHEQH